MAARRGSVVGGATSVIAGGSSVLKPEDNPNASIDRYLRSHNPNVGSTPVYFDFKKDARTFKLFPSVDHTATHLSFDGNLIRADTDEAKKLEEDRKRREHEMERAEEAERNPDLVEQGVSTRILKNQFNYCERASQTINPPRRGRLVLTDPPPSIPYPNSVSQQIIFDAYEEERMANERAAAGKHQAAQAAAGRGGRGGKGGAGGAAGAAADEKKEGAGSGQDIQSSAAYLSALRILERMVNQNDSADIVDDFAYWEDASDQHKPDGNLLPLWKFTGSDKIGGGRRTKEVTACVWNPKYTDLFAVGYGSYEFNKQGTGAVLCFTLKNAFPSPSSGPAFPAHPEFSMQLDSGVMSIDFHPTQCALLACGLYDGSVCVFDLRQRGPDGVIKPQFQSTVRTGKHTDPVWDVRWSRDASSGTLQFFSISSDGRVTAWHLSKNELQHSDIMQLTVSGADAAAAATTAGQQQGAGGHEQRGGGNAAAAGQDGSALVDPEAALLNVSGGTCFDFSWESENIFVVGTEDGFVRRCSKAYNAQYLDAYEGHHMAVYAVRWNHFHSGVFLSCSADWTVKLWEKGSSRPLLTFDLGNSVGDVAWAPYSSTVFAAVTSDGKVHVFDLKENKNEPLCAQQVVKAAKLNRIVFNPRAPIILVGDTRGGILSLKLSPNLRKPIKLEKGMLDDPASMRQYQLDKLNNIISITLKDRELLDR